MLIRRRLSLGVLVGWKVALLRSHARDRKYVLLQLEIPETADAICASLNYKSSPGYPLLSPGSPPLTTFEDQPNKEKVCRASSAKVLSLRSHDLTVLPHSAIAESIFDSNFTYSKGQIVTPDYFSDSDYASDHGIHFFIRRSQAVDLMKDFK